MAKSQFDYSASAKAVASAIDIGIEALTTHPPKGYSTNHLSMMVNGLKGIRESVLHPAQEFMTQKSLKFLEADALQYFQEGGGQAVEWFWGKVQENGLPFKRSNALAKILKKGKISNRIEYDLVNDLIGPYTQLNLLSSEETLHIHRMIAEFEVTKHK